MYVYVCMCVYGYIYIYIYSELSYVRDAVRTNHNYI